MPSLRKALHLRVWGTLFVSVGITTALACNSQNENRTPESATRIESAALASVGRAETLARPEGRLSRILSVDGARTPAARIESSSTASYFWTEESPAASPGIRDSHAMAYDVASAQTILFSGDVCTASCAMAPNDTWTWNGTTWSKPTLSTSPQARYWSAMAYDSARSVVILFGGVQASGLDLSDTWEWNGSSWTQLSPATNPGARDAFSMAYDSVRQVTVLFGGEKCANKTCSTLTNLNDTWEWNGTTWAQKTTTTAPSPRIGSGMAFDTAHQVAVLFGGSTCSSTCNTSVEYGDTWEWNGTAWTQESPAAAPSARDSFSMSYDSLRSTTVLFGGFGGNGETWEWSGSAWTEVTPATSPSSRLYAPMVFDSAHGRSVIYGGSTGAADLTDTWEYYAHGNACTSAGQCDTASCVDSVCCDSASCGTCQACNTAGNLGACAAVLNAPDPPSCTGTETCDGTGQCKLVVGQACPAGNSACANGDCVNGYCCSSACTGACQVCAQSLGATANGTCTPAAQGYSGNPTCTGGYMCNGTSPACPATCSADGDCTATYYCNALGACTPRKAQGASCSSTAGVDCLKGECRECASGTCADGVCCNVACSGSCDVCAKALGASADGTCTTAPQGYAGAPTCSPYVCTGTSESCPAACTGTSGCASGAFCTGGACQGTLTPGQACGAASACASGFCVDGVCCDGACTGECEACDVEGSGGMCTPVAGAPHGSRPACPTGSAAEPCASAQCDGNTRASCTGFVGSSVTCVQASCTSGVATLPASCDGLGNCPAAVTTKCDPYVCDGTACKQACMSDVDCASGERCDLATGECVAGVTCDGNQTITGVNGQTTDCAPYTCDPSGCLTSCESLQDCVSPAVCNGAGQCVLPPTGEASQTAGCALSPRSRDAGSTGEASFGLLVLAGLARRRRGRRPAASRSR